jgi:hypothetical protein
MAEVEVARWTKSIVPMTKPDIIKFQVMVHCHIYKIRVSSADLDCLALLGQYGKAELTSFCELMVTQKIFKTLQSSRNAITRLQDKSMILKDKEPRGKKMISIHPDLQIQNRGNILVEVKCFSPDKN